MSNPIMISIVDDDLLVREATADLVSSLGYQACTFESAEEFLETGKADETSCLITDVQMPGLSGLELQERLGAGDCRIPIIFITAFPRDSARERAMAAGAVAFLSKPYKEDTLIQALELALSRERVT
jgi:FixJ family two-component response regulator